MSLGEALGGISGEKFRGEKNDKKKVGKAVHPGLPRRDTRTPVRRDFREEFLGMGPARLRSSFGWAGGLFTLRESRRGQLEAWRLEGLEAWTDRKIAIEAKGGGDWRIGGVG